MSLQGLTDHGSGSRTPAQMKKENLPLKYQNIIFDFDSTIVNAEALDFLAELVLQNNPEKDTILQKIKDITNLGMNGEISFDVSLSQRMALIAPTHDQVTRAGQQITEMITKSFLEHKDFFATYADNIYIISGGFEEMILPTANKLGVRSNHVLSNKFIFDKSGNVTRIDVSRPTSQHLGKVKQLQALNLSGSSIIIGDGYTDYEIKKNDVAEKFVAYTEHAYRENVIPYADIEAKSFEDILKFITK